MDTEKQLEEAITYFKLYEKYLAEGDKEKAEEYLDKAFRIKQELYDYYWHLHIECKNLGEEEKSNEYLQKLSQMRDELSECMTQIIINTKRTEKIEDLIVGNEND